MDLEEQIRKFAQKRGVKEEDFPAFRDKLLTGLKQMGLDEKEIDLEKYKKAAKEGMI